MNAAEPNFCTYDTEISPYELPELDRPLKIALLSYRSHPYVGGQGIYVKYLSRALLALGHQIDIFSGPPYPEVDENINLIKVPSLDLFSTPSHIRALRPKHLLSFTDTLEWWTMLSGGFAEPYTFGRRVEKLLNGRDYDIIHDNQSLCYALPKMQRRGIRVVTTIHHPIHRDRDLALQAAKRWGDRLLIRRWYSFLRMQESVVNQLNYVTTVSNTSQADIETYFHREKHHVKVIPNGIDTNIFRPLDIPAKKYRIMTTASSDQPLKGLKFLLQAISRLKHDYPKIHLHVIGQLKSGGDTQKQIANLGLQKDVHFISGISTDALVKEFNQAEIFVCPSLYEGFGLPVGEAMACGKAVIATDGGALQEVTGKAGITIGAGDSNAIEQKIRLLLENPEQKATLEKSARKHIVENFSWSCYARP